MVATITGFQHPAGKLLSLLVGSADILLPIMEHAEGAELLSEEQFEVEGTLIESRALQKRIRPKNNPPFSSTKGRNEESDFQEQKRAKDACVYCRENENFLFRI